MKLRTFEIPDEPAQVAPWLERHLMGLELPYLVAELEVLGGGSEVPELTLEAALGVHLDTVLAMGLCCLTREQMRPLLRHPQLLLALQRRVLDEGSDYWTTVPADKERTAHSQASWQTLEQAIREPLPVTLPLRQPSVWRSARLWAGAGWVSTAAALLFSFFMQGGRVQQLEQGLAELTARNDALRKELSTQQRVAMARVLPADLPEEGEAFAQSVFDPQDLPRDDPADLPEIS